MKKKILIVEDEMIVAQDLKESLKSLGYKVIGVVDSGEEALASIEKENPDLILLDILLKGHLNGIETAEKARNITDAKIVYLTAYADERTIQKAKLTNPAGYILKPFGERELRATIEVALQNNEIDTNGLKDEVNNLLKQLGKPPKYNI